MKLLPAIAAAAAFFLSLNVYAVLPLGLKCDSKIKIVDAEIGKVGEYEVQKGMEKEKHTALIDRQKTSAVDGCSFNVEVGQTVVARYSGPQTDDTEVQCIDLNNNNAAVKFPDKIYTVRSSNVSPHYLNPYCPDGGSKDGFPCSKLGSQSERGMEYKEKVLRSNATNRLFLADLVFDRPYVSRVTPYTPSVPSNAKLFCALITKSSTVVIAATAQYPEAAPPPQSSGKEATDEKGSRRSPRTRNALER